MNYLLCANNSNLPLTLHRFWDMANYGLIFFDSGEQLIANEWLFWDGEIWPQETRNIHLKEW